jgi:hypothetical protein
VTVIVALAVGWWVDHYRQNAAARAVFESQQEVEEKLNRLLTAMESRGEEVTFSDMMVGIRSERGGAKWSITSSIMPGNMSWLIWTLWCSQS